MFSCKEQVLHAEVLQALQLLQLLQLLDYSFHSYSFPSLENNNVRFNNMFSDSKIAQSYRQGKAKVRYKISMT